MGGIGKNCRVVVNGGMWFNRERSELVAIHDALSMTASRSQLDDTAS
jgi:hypothetical protein